MNRLERRKALLALIEAEIDRAEAKHGPANWSRHEFHSIALEEFEEMWDEIKHNGPDRCLLAELVQVAAVCVRYAEMNLAGGES